MDDRHLARLVDEVERAFPGDLAAQREAWEFLEVFMDAWDETGATGAATAVADAGQDQPATTRRLLAACRELLRDATGRVASALEELVPPDPAVLLRDAPESPTVEIDAEAATELGIDPEITVEVGPDFVTLMATIGESSTPERLAVVLQTPETPDARDGSVIVRHFIRLDQTLATAHFDTVPTSHPLALALVIFDPGSV
jgi:hypothetical protein